jgi:histidine triad (HIT) family protein
MSDCIFCKIINNKIQATIVHEDKQLVAFQDMNPQTPTHILIVPRKHIETLNDLTIKDDVLIGAMVRLAARIAADRGHNEKGYRTVFNCNSDGGQTVYHIHLHLLGGRVMGRFG